MEENKFLYKIHFVLLLVSRCSAFSILACFPTFLPSRRWRLCDQIDLSVILSVRVQPARKKLCMDLHEIYNRGILAHSQGDFILEVIWVDLHGYLEVSVAQKGHFGIKSTVTQKW